MNIMNMMKQAQQMQAKLQETQKRLGEMSHEGSAGGGVVKITLSGAGVAKAVTIDSSATGDVETLQDLVLIAINDAKGKADAMAAEEMKKATAGINLPPGVQLPF